MIASRSSALTTLSPGKTTGRPESSSCSLLKAIRLPDRVTAPMRTLSWMVTDVSMASWRPCSSESRNSPMPTSSDAPPPSPLSSATIWGIAVILTERAIQRPRALPTRSPAASTP